MSTFNKKFKSVDELSIGMMVKATQLENIYDICILLANPEGCYDDDGYYTIQGKICFIGNEPNNCKKAFEDNIINNVKPAMITYHKDEITEGIYYE